MKSAIIGACIMLASALVYVGVDMLTDKFATHAPLVHCIGGVSYLEFQTGVTVQLSAKGEIVTCGAAAERSADHGRVNI